MEPNISVQHSAGGIVYRAHHKSIDICMIRDSYGRWTFPKGHMEPNERLEETARREIAEETGINEHALKLRLELGEIDYWFISHFATDKGTTDKSTESAEPLRIHKYVTYYLYEVPPDTELSPQITEIEAASWIPLYDLDHHNEYEDNLPIIRKAKDYLHAISY